MKTVFSFIVLIPLLVGCIFGNKEANKEPQKGPGPLDGYVSMVDARGFKMTDEGLKIVYQNDVVAQFTKKASMRRSLYSSLKAFESLPEREFKCNFSSTKPSASASQSIISVGKLSLEMAGASLDLPFSQKMQAYYHALETEMAWKKGTYSVRAEGSADALSFEGTLSMPEALESAAVNGELLENGPVSIVTNSSIEISWKQQTKPAEMDYMLFQLYGEKDGAKLNLLCGIKESEVTTSWTIPAEKVKEFSPNLTKGEIYVYRGNLARAEDPKIGRLDTEGLRLAIAPVQFTN